MTKTKTPSDTESTSPESEGNKPDDKPEAPLTWRQRLLSWGGQALLFLGLYLAITAWMTSGMLPLGQPAPDFQLTSLSGTKHQLSQYKGKRVILHVWATWCSACKMNMPMMRLVAPNYRQDPVLLTVVTDGHRRNAVRAIVEKKKLNYPVLLGSQKLARAFRISKYPTTYFIDKRGRVSSKDSGVITPFGFWTRSLWLRVKGWFR